MQLELKQPLETLNTTYRRANLGLAQATTFKNNLSKLLEGINDKETEENQKNIVIEFLKNTYYKDLHEVNTKGRQDLVIHNDKTAKSSVGVIIEVKRTSNKAEMISAENPNAKALQELLHYYLKERFISNNKEIKHLIITNIYEWYVFDGADFERFFFEDKKLKENYKNWTEGKLGINTTEWFYKEIAKPFLEDKTLECTYFDIRKLKHIVTSEDLDVTANNELLLDIYKIFSPEHLLKHSFQNDANTLNTAFYNELLHILGLEETGTSKKIITRIANENDRNKGSLLERIINSLDRNSSYEQYPNKKEFGETPEEQLFSFALELCITWLNRILFLKLLEGQLLKYHQKDPQQKFLNISKIENFSMLDTLFFEILAVPVADREQDIAGKFANIPYLNSSLFDKTELENVLQISLLERNLTMPIFNATVLKDDNGKRIVGQKSTLQYLFEFLDAFDFASDADTVIQENDKTIINSAVLGLIFEKLNGYKDGSVFTPSFITMYMCREGIRKAVIQKFNDQYHWNCKNFNDLQNRIDDITKEEANKTFNKLRICDPAVGSGHFLVSALNEIIVIKHELKILIDKKGRRLREHHISTQNDELVIINKENGKNFVYDYRDDEKQEVQELLFNEKQIIIENCLFGVDINAKSVLICRLRLWIELLKNMYYTQESKFKELETFPNIDINIKTGNSLISKFNLDDKMNDFAPAARQYIKKMIPDYKIQVELYKSVKDRNAKYFIIKNIKEYKNNFSKMFNPKDKDFRAWKDKENEWFVSANSAFLEYELTSKLLEESNALKAVYDNKMAIYKNAFEWRFEFPEVLNDDGDFIGFDLVIGNPPYISIKEISEMHKELFLKTFEVADGQFDLYILFMELSQKMLRDDGYSSMITSNTYLSNQNFKKIRHFLLNKTILSEIVNLDESVFTKAKLDVAITSFTKGYTESTEMRICDGRKAFDDRIFTTLSSNIFKLSENLEFKIGLKGTDIPLFDKMATNAVLLSTIANINRGTEFGGNSDLIKDVATENMLPIIVGGDIGKYIIKQISGHCEWKMNKSVFKDKDLFTKPRILIQRIRNLSLKQRLVATYTEDSILCTNTLRILTLTDKNFAVKFVLALINSTLFNYYFKSNFLNKDIYAYQLGQLSIKKASKKAQKPFIDLVDAIISQKAAGLDSLENERKIDALVYDLYEITAEEQKIIEGK